MLRTTVNTGGDRRRGTSRGWRLAAGLAALLFATAAGDGGSAPLAGDLSGADLRIYRSACECELVRGAMKWADADTAASNPKNVVFASREDRGAAFVTVEGALVRFALVERQGEFDCLSHPSRVERWQSESGVKLRLKLRAVQAGAEACWYQGTMTVTSGKKSQTIPVTGSCGC